MKSILFPFFIFLTSISFAQKVPIIHASSTSVDISENKELRKNAWTISPDLKPDIYTVHKKNATVTFITDKESISFKTKPGTKIDFIILLNNKDTAWTQILYDEKQLDVDYLKILKNAKKYDDNQIRQLPKFTYQSHTDTNLIALRKGFKLDSIAGEGNEISKLLNLLHWIHDLIPHDGNHENPQVKNAMSLINTCKNEHRGLNCRGLATVLNECYLSLGFKSRMITCMPKDSIFNDCHVINMVYSNDLQKWVWLDPTHNAYVMDEKGNLLSIEEVRNRVINNKPLILNPNANWNHKVSTVKEYYLLKYMAKNLYRLECPVRSEYDFETRIKGKNTEYIELLPLDAYHQDRIVREMKNDKMGYKITTYKTNNPNLFWAKPMD